ncbi:MAG: hypothetical protein ACP5G0_08535 [Desulfomonilia bacterium]
MEYNFFNDRRKNLRKQVQIKASVQLTELIKGVGYLKDVTLESVRISTPDLFAFFNQEQAELFQDKVLMVALPSEALTLKGKIIRVDTAKDELIVMISSVSDAEAWKKLCR